MGNRNVYKVALEVLLFGICVFLLFSCLPSGIIPGIDKGFSLGDKPSEFVWPHNEPAKNLCGQSGAFLAYYMMYYIGSKEVTMIDGHSGPCGQEIGN